MNNTPLMPKSTAIWLIDNTTLTFKQIALFCNLHPLEIKAIADGDVAQGVRGQNPIQSGELTRESIKLAQNDENIELVLTKPKLVIPKIKNNKNHRYTPLSRRQDKPSTILWLIKFHPELIDNQIIKLIGTTRPTIKSIRDHSHWNIQNIKPIDPVTLGLCKQIELNNSITKALVRVERDRKKSTVAGTLLPAEETTVPAYKKNNDNYAEIIGNVNDTIKPKTISTSNDIFNNTSNTKTIEPIDHISADDVFSNFKNKN